MSAQVSVPLAFSIVKKKTKKKKTRIRVILCSMKTKLYRDLFTSTIKETREEVFQRRQDFVPCQKVENVPSTWRQLHLGTSSLRPVCPALAALVCLHWLRMLTHSSDATAAATHVISLKECYVFLPTSAKRLEIKTDFLEDRLWGLGEGPFNYFLCLLEELPPGP